MWGGVALLHKLLLDGEASADEACHKRPNVCGEFADKLDFSYEPLFALRGKVTPLLLVAEEELVTSRRRREEGELRSRARVVVEGGRVVGKCPDWLFLEGGGLSPWNAADRAWAHFCFSS